MTLFKQPCSESLFIFTLGGISVGVGLIVKDKRQFFKFYLVEFPVGFFQVTVGLLSDC